MAVQRRRIRPATEARLLVVCAAVLCLAQFAPAPSAVAADPAEPVPDISGFWRAPSLRFEPLAGGLTLTPDYARKLKATREASDRGEPVADPVSRCEAFGMPRLLTMDQEILVTPGRVTMISEVLHEVRRVYLDGRKPPPDLEPSYGGYSTGAWENGELVVRTTGLRESTMDQYGIPYSDQLQITERYKLVDKDTLRDRVTLEDPKAFTRPWTFDWTFKRAEAGAEMFEYICVKD